MSKPREACGIFGVFGDPKAVEMTYCGLFTLQHRGQESAGIASVDVEKRCLKSFKGMGRVAEVFKGRHLEALESHAAMGHVRYSTTGDSEPANAQPILVQYNRGQVALAHNGNLVNRKLLRTMLEEQGSIFSSTTDSEVVLHLLARCSKHQGLNDAMKTTLSQLRGAFSLLMLWPDRLIAIRDPWGFRPLWYGKRGDTHLFASETAALDIVGATPEFEVEPGTFVVVDENGLKTHRYHDPITPRHCMFEHIYFARPDSQIFGDLVQDVRIKSGRTLAREYPVEADVVCSIPDSGNDAALGYSLESGIPLGYCFVRNHYIGRTFINPSAKDRLTATDLKLNLIKGAVEGQRVVVIDDSMVRGTTAKKRIKRLREAGAKEVHFRVASPPVISPCHYGIDFQSKGELIAARHDLETIRKDLGLDSLGYLTLDGLKGCLSSPDDYCTACWTRDYPVQEGVDADFEV